MSMTIEDVIRDERRRAHKKRDLAEAFRDEANKIPALKHAKRHDQIADWLEALKKSEEKQKEAEVCAKLQLLNELLTKSKDHALTATDIQALIDEENKKIEPQKGWY